MPDNNLNVSISADVVKFRSGLELAKQALQQFGREVKQAAQEAAKTGETAQLDRVAERYERLRARVQAYQQALAAAGRETRAHESFAKRLAENFADLAESLGAAGHFLGLFKGGLIGLAVGTGIAETAKVIKDVTNHIQELQRISRATGFETGTIQAVQKAIKDTGGDAAEAGPLLDHLNRSYAELTQVAEKAGQVVGSGVTVLKGYKDQLGSTTTVLNGTRAGLADSSNAMLTVIRGAKPLVTDIKDVESAYRALGVRANEFAQDEKGHDQLLEATARGLIKWKEAGRIDVADLIAWQTLGRHYREVAKALDEFAKTGSIASLKKQLAESGALVTDADKRRNEDYIKSINELSEAWEGFKKSLTFAITPILGPLMRGFSAIVDAIRKNIDDLVEHVPAAIAQMGQQISAMFQVLSTNIKQAWSDLLQWLTGAFNSALGGIMSAIQAAAQAVASVASAVSSAAASATSTPGTNYMAPGAFAGGGQVPGSGSGDTVPAWLTPGEYVARQSSVRYYGADLFRALNNQMIPRDMFRGFGFALGGLVDSIHRPTHFADGGLVASAGGTPVAFSLHLSGKEFLAHASAPVATRLVQEARVQSMRSAGIKPSWVS